MDRTEFQCEHSVEDPKWYLRWHQNTNLIGQNNTASIVNTEAALYALGKREKQKQIDGRKIALQKPNKTIFLKKFVSLS